MVASAYQVATLAIRPEGWPAAWRRYADERLHTAASSDLTPLRVVYAANGIAPHSSDEGRNRAEVRTRPYGMDFGVSAIIEGTYVDHEATLRITSHTDVPAIGLGNGLRLFLSSWLPYRLGGLMLHAAAGIRDGRGVVFPGVSTAGKSTLATGFRHTTYLTDDIAVVDGLPSSARVVGAPFFGMNGWLGSAERAPLAALAILGKSDAGTTIERLPASRAVPLLLRHAVLFSRDRELVAAALARATELADTVPVLSLRRDLRDSSDDVFDRVLEAAR